MPIFQLFLSSDCFFWCEIFFKVNQLFEFVFLGEPIKHFLFVLIDSANKVVGNSNIDGCVLRICKDINII